MRISLHDGVEGIATLEVLGVTAEGMNLWLGRVGVECLDDISTCATQWHQRRG